MRNLNLLFNKTYYETLTATTFSGVSKCNQLIFDTVFSHDRDYAKPGAMVTDSFLLKVCYPGLLVGIGLSHDAGMDNDEISVGFCFDYVTGQPYIPGSNIKGILRSHFKDHPQVIAELCGKDLAWVRQLESEIFDYADIFFDAVVYDGDRHHRLMGPDVITPHKSLTEQPIPINLVKILPDVRFSFRFRLMDSPLMNREEKVALFRKLLCLFGIGAKTNVGFGVLKEDKTNGAIYSETQASDSKVGQINRIVCPHCGVMNYRCKPNSNEQWPSWPKCHNRTCGKDLL